MVGSRTPFAPVDHSPEREHRRLIAERANNNAMGKLHNLGEVTLTANQTTTTITDTRIGGGSFLFFTPLTADARSEGIPALTSTDNGTATLTHSNDASTDRDYVYAIFG